ncbi:MAG: TIGR02584 family CRISPR-associated protein [Kiritimatiellae bacterium]|nr:TIGR02584 family CRISPR-associated protein [Kiritimatiellia bacterium]
MEQRIILVAGMGTSPAVLTETVWALAHQAKPVLPHEVVVLTTKTGKIRLSTEILSGTPSVWEKLKAALRKEKIGIDDRLVFGETSIRVIPDRDGNEADDLRTGEDNLRTADFMLQQIRQYSEASDTVILASIAGGRKTMSALLFSCMRHFSDAMRTRCIMFSFRRNMNVAWILRSTSRRRARRTSC